MFRLSKKADYALLTLQYLGSEEASGVANTRAIAGRFDIPGELLAKTLQQLARHGFVTEHRASIADTSWHGRHMPSLSRTWCRQLMPGDVHGLLTPRRAVRAVRDVHHRDLLWRVKEQILAVLQTATVADMNDGGDHHAPLTIRTAESGAAAQVQTR